MEKEKDEDLVVGGEFKFDEANEEEDSQVKINKGTVSGSQHYKVYGYRWVALSAFTACLFINGAANAFYSPITFIVKKAYDVALIEVNMVIMLQKILYIPSSFFISNLIIEKLGTYPSLIYGGSAIIIGMAIKLLINYNYYWIWVANIVAGLGQPLLLNCPPKISASWFGIHQRPLATTLLSLGSPVGVAAGYLLPTIFVTVSQKDLDKELAREQVYDATLYCGIIFTAVVIASWFLFREKPATPPSASAGDIKRKKNIKKDLKMLLCNRNFQLLAYTFSMGFMIMNAIDANLAPIVAPFGLEAKHAAFIGGGFLVFGIVGAGVFAAILGKTKKFQLSQMLIFIIGLIGTLGIIGALYTEIFVVVLLSGCLLGFSLLPSRTVLMEYGCELGYPAAEATISGYLISISQFSTVIMITISGFTLNNAEHYPYYVAIYLGIIGVLIISCLVIGFFVKEDLKRLKKDLIGEGLLSVEEEKARKSRRQSEAVMSFQY